MLRGRPALNIEWRLIVATVRQHRKVTAAAKELRCSPAFIHKQFSSRGIRLEQVLDASITCEEEDAQ